jgi:hypothetical protein
VESHFENNSAGGEAWVETFHCMSYPTHSITTATKMGHGASLHTNGPVDGAPKSVGTQMRADLKLVAQAEDGVAAHLVGLGDGQAAAVAAPHETWQSSSQT